MIKLKPNFIKIQTISSIMLVISTIIIVIGISTCANFKKHNINIEGVWKLVSTEPVNPDGSIVRSNKNWEMMKIYSKSHFVFSEQAPNRPNFVNGGDERELCDAAKGFFGGAGTYKIDSDSTFTEHIKIFLNPSYINAKVTYKCKFISKNLWSQEGYLPAKSLGLADEDLHIFEVWERIE